jgi:hypothetical protein
MRVAATWDDVLRNSLLEPAHPGVIAESLEGQAEGM